MYPLPSGIALNDRTCCRVSANHSAVRDYLLQFRGQTRPLGWPTRRPVVSPVDQALLLQQHSRLPGSLPVPTHRYPVLVVRDPAGAFTAVAVDEDDLAGFGPTAAAARDDLKNYLEWAHRRTPWMRVPDFLDPELHTFKVNVRPEYQTEKRIYPCDQSVTVRVPCVTGRQASGQRLASLPLLGSRFTYHEPASLKALAQRYALQKLEGLTPQELARHLALPHVELADVVVRIPRDVATDENVEAPMTLGRVAEPLGERAVR